MIDQERWQQAAADAFWRIEAMTDIELTDRLRENYVNAVVGEKKARSLEEALQEALDNTTPEHSGSPDHSSDRDPEQFESEWI